MTVDTKFAAEPTGQKVWDVVRVASGNFLEMYDFMVFGYFAGAIGAAYFPAGNELSTLLKSLATFGVGFLMRPIGAVVLGAYTDRYGRRAGLLLTLVLMSLGILALAFTPGYMAIGILAPIVVLAGRLVQGFRQGLSSAMSRSIWPKWRRRGKRAFTSPGSRPPSRWRW